MATPRAHGTNSTHRAGTRPGRCIGTVTDGGTRRRVSRRTKTDVRAKLRNLTAETFNPGRGIITRLAGPNPRTAAPRAGRT
jgi:hypothetical protein